MYTLWLVRHSLRAIGPGRGLLSSVREKSLAAARDEDCGLVGHSLNVASMPSPEIADASGEYAPHCFGGSGGKDRAVL